MGNIASLRLLKSLLFEDISNQSKSPFLPSPPHLLHFKSPHDYYGAQTIIVLP